MCLMFVSFGAIGLSILCYPGSENNFFVYCTKQKLYLHISVSGSNFNMNTRISVVCGQL